MNKKLNNPIAILLFVVGLFFFLAPAVQAVNLQNAFSDQLNTVGTRGGFNTSQRNVEPIIGTIISVVLSYLGVIFLVLMIYGGYMWMTAAGNEEKAKKARQLIQAAVLGLIVVVGAYAITVFVMGRIAKDLISGGAYDSSKGSQDTGAKGCCLSRSDVLGDKCFDNDTSGACSQRASSQWFSGQRCSDLPTFCQSENTTGGCCIEEHDPVFPSLIKTYTCRDTGPLGNIDCNPTGLSAYPLYIDLKKCTDPECQR